METTLQFSYLSETVHSNYTLRIVYPSNSRSVMPSAQGAHPGESRADLRPMATTIPSLATYLTLSSECGNGCHWREWAHTRAVNETVVRVGHRQAQAPG